jgi:putative AlgH/UPF0301 family transcriptional regulator
MFLRKICVFTLLAAVVVFALVRTLDARRGGLVGPARTTCSYDPASRFMGESKNWPVQADAVCCATSEILAPASLPTHSNAPIPSKNPKDLGLGKLLVASRNLADPIFAKTVILLVRYDADGVVGLVLNRRTKVPLSRMFEQFKAAKGRSDPVYLGGPVQLSAAFALRRSTAKIEEAEPVFGGVYLISSQSAFEKAIASRADPRVFHVYLGYAGWTNDQLRKEVEAGAWFIFSGDAQTVFDRDPDSLWRQMIQQTELTLTRSEPGRMPFFNLSAVATHM